MASRDNNDQNDRERHRCPHCPASYDTGQKLGGHMRKHCLKPIFRNGRRRQREAIPRQPPPPPPPQQQRLLLQDANLMNRRVPENNLSLVPYRQHDAVANSRLPPPPRVLRDGGNLRPQERQRFAFGSFLSIDSMLQHEVINSRQHQDEVSNSRQQQQIEAINSRQQQNEANSSRMGQNEVNSSRRVGIGRFLSALSKIEHEAINSRKQKDHIEAIDSRKQQEDIEAISSRKQKDIIEVIDSSRRSDSELGTFLSLSLTNPLMDGAVEEEMLRWKEEKAKREKEEEEKNKMDDDDDVEEGEIVEHDRRDVDNNKGICFRRLLAGNSKKRDPNFYTFL